MKSAAGFDSEEVGARFGLVGGEGAEDLYLTASHESYSDGGLLIGLEFSLDEEFCADDLTFPAGGFVIPVDGV